MGIFKKKNKIFAKSNIDFSDENLASSNLASSENDLTLDQQPNFTPSQQLNSVGFDDVTSETNSLTIDFTKRPNLFDSQEVQSVSLVNYNQIQEVADSLLTNKMVCIDLSSINNSQERKRIIDFLSGIIYAFKGTVEVMGVRSYCFKI